MSSPVPLPEIEAEASKIEKASEALEFLRARLKHDSRAGALRLLGKFEKKVFSQSKEAQRLEGLWKHEKEAEDKGARFIAGVDEAGRGPLAGPVVAAAVILPSGSGLAGVDDSKKLTAAKRGELFLKIRERALGVGVGQASVAEIDQLNIYRAAQLAMERAILALDPKPDYLLTDAMPLPKLSTLPQKPLIHGDSLSLSIAAASIIAKVTRDGLMGELHQRYPNYGFENHKGYGTEEHLKALETHGTCPEHRVTFGPVLETLAKKSAGGPFGYWKEKLAGSRSPGELQQVGLQIKRAALSHLTEAELETLRQLFRGKRNEWQNKKP
jgi:ribonuclease HII